ncbi:MAG TPA: metal-dependent hydrolase [Acidobacteriota bacterium]|nr:metal-dependent hydrolase [Acidobacteriota bacterium]
MRGITHLFLGLAVGLAIYHVHWFVFLVVLGALLPDLDSPRSMLGRFFWVFNSGVTHRGFLHSLWFLLLFLCIMYYMGYMTYFFPVMIGIVSHLLLDILTPAGVSLFYPISFKLRGVSRTGGIVDWLLLVASIGLCFYFIYYSY